MGANSKPNGYLVVQNGYANVIKTMTNTTTVQKLLHIVKSTAPFLAFLLFYFSNKILKILPALEDLGCVHIYTINNIEEFIFGCHPHRIISAYHNPFLDFLSAMPYLIHYIIPIIFPAYLLFKGHAEDVAKFYWLLGWVMWVHYLLWMIFPHTPPWVIDSLQRANTTTAGSIPSMNHREGCAFARLDKFTGASFFYKMFTGNPIPYASFPSGHVAWPTVALSVTPFGSKYLAGYIMCVMWATLYSCHHYILDTIAALIIVSCTQKVLVYLSDKQVCSSDYKCRTTAITCPFPV